MSLYLQFLLRVLVLTRLPPKMGKKGKMKGGKAPGALNTLEVASIRVEKIYAVGGGLANMVASIFTASP